MKKVKYIIILLAASVLIRCTEVENKLPNIVILYADDMGYGDLNIQNPDSKIPTPYLDKLASEGMRFTDAHSSSGICSPSRYALLTGTYHWRKQHGIVGSFGKPFFNDSDITLPDVLRENGYTTTCIGKWHLGWNWEFKNNPSGETMLFGRSHRYYQPFFLYFSFPSPHTPIIPNEEFIGKSGAGGYGDFVYQTDWVAGQILHALKENGFYDNTIVIFTSDNGPERFAYQRALEYDHFSMGDFRGLKQDIWEGGHRVPMIIRWPGHVEPGTVSDKLISQIDYMATLAAAAGITLPDGAAPDSYNFLPAVLDKNDDTPEREVLIHNTYATKWAVRQGDWLYMDTNSGGHQVMPEFFTELRGYADFETERLLFNLKDDPDQRINLFDQYLEKVIEMERLITNSKEKGYLIKD